MLMGPSGFVAVLAGWITTEVGRQPYTVYGLLRTADSRLAVDAAGGRRLAARLHRRLLRRVRRGHLLHPAPDAASRRMRRDRDARARAPTRAAGITPAPQLAATGRLAMLIDLAFIWAGLIAFAVLAYVLLDGFDLGIGILFPLFPERARPRRR